MSDSQESFSRYLCWAKNVREWPLKRFKRMVASELRLMNEFGSYVACEGIKIVGYASFSEAWDQDGLQEVYWTASSHQGQGIATKLMEHMIDQAFLYRNIDYIEIHVADGNIGSHKVAQHFKPYANSEYWLSETQEKGTEENGHYTVYYLVNPRTLMAYKARELMGYQSMALTFGERKHDAPAYGQMQAYLDVVEAFINFSKVIQSI